MRRKRIYGHRRIQRSPIKQVNDIKRDDEKDPSQDISDTAKEVANISGLNEINTLQKEVDLNMSSDNSSKQDVANLRMIQENTEDIDDLKNKQQ